MPECQYCGKWFRTKRGLKQHITKAHTTEIPFSGRVLDPTTFDFLGAMERREERRKRRKKGPLW
jgi:hypothetical protein